VNRVHEQRCDGDPRPSDVGAEDDPRRSATRRGVGRFNIAATDDVEAPFIGRNIVNPLALDTSHKEWSIMMTMFIPKSSNFKMDERLRCVVEHGDECIKQGNLFRSLCFACCSRLRRLLVGIAT
jgi:hypothetical protein